MTEQLRAFAASFRGLEHPFQHPAVHNYITPAPGDPRPSSGLYGFTHICGINTHVHISKNSKKHKIKTYGAVYAYMHVFSVARGTWRFENSLMCQFLPSTLFEDRFLIFYSLCQAICPTSSWGLSCLCLPSRHRRTCIADTLLGVCILIFTVVQKVLNLLSHISRPGFIPVCSMAQGDKCPVDPLSLQGCGIPVVLPSRSSLALGARLQTS